MAKESKRARLKKTIRKRLLIDNNFQMKFLIRMIIPLIVFVILSALWVFLLLSYLQAETSNIDVFIQKINSEYNSLSTFFTFLKISSLLGFLVLLILSSLYVFYFHFLYSHRIIGPVMAFKKIFQELKAGNLNAHIQLREKDEFHDAADDLNAMITDLKARVKRIHQLTQHSMNTITDMKEDISEEDKDKLDKLDKLLALSEGIDESVNSFRYE